MKGIDKVTLDIEREGVDIEVLAHIDIHDGEAFRSALDLHGRVVELTDEERQRAHEKWIDVKALRRDAYEADAYDRKSDR